MRGGGHPMRASSLVWSIARFLSTATRDVVPGRRLMMLMYADDDREDETFVHAPESGRIWATDPDPVIRTECGETTRLSNFVLGCP